MTGVIINNLLKEMQMDLKASKTLYDKVVSSDEFKCYKDIHDHIIFSNSIDENTIINAIDSESNPQYSEKLGFRFSLDQKVSSSLPMTPQNLASLKKTLIPKYDRLVKSDCKVSSIQLIIDNYFNFKAFDTLTKEECDAIGVNYLNCSWLKYNAENWSEYFDNVMNTLFSDYHFKKNSKSHRMFYKSENPNFKITIEYNKKDLFDTLKMGNLSLPDISINLYYGKKNEKLVLSNFNLKYAPALKPIDSVIMTKKIEIEQDEANSVRMDFFRIISSNRKKVYDFDEDDIYFQKKYLIHYCHYKSLFTKSLVDYISSILKRSC